MADISASLVKDLRERTGLGMMECKKALVESNGDIELAIENLRKSSGMKAAKKAGRTAAEGVVATKVSADGKFAALIEVNCETDFVARDENFNGFVQAVLGKVFTDKQADVTALMDSSLEQTRQALVQKIGENINVRRIALVSAPEGVIGNYVHSNFRIGVLVALKGANAEVAKDVSMHIAASKPEVVKGEDMPADVLAKEKEIYVAQAAESGKPAEVIEKMVQGRIRKFLEENSLVDQPFVKDPEIKVGALVKKAGGEVQSFVRFEVGEGIEVEKVDFAAEVAATAKSF